MMGKKREEVPYLSYEDSVRLMREVQREYGVIVSFKLAPSQFSKTVRGYCFYWECRRIAGQKDSKCVWSRVVEFPSNTARTFPGMVVHTLNILSSWLEEERGREAAALAQLPLFAAD